VGIRVASHLLHFVLAEARGRRDRNLLFVLGRPVFGSDVKDAVRVDIECDLDLWNSAGRRWNVAQLEGGVERINSAREKLESASHRLAEAMYRATAGQEQAAGGAQGDGGAGAQQQQQQQKENVVDAEFVDVEDKNKK
jgi:hypothetical protein